MNAHQPVNIVMIEDDEGHARLIEKNIRRAGISNALRHFLDGTSALKYLFEDPEGPMLNGPALVLLDLNLPDMSGTDILARIKGDERLHRGAGGGPHDHRRQGRDPALLRSWLQRLHHQAGQLRKLRRRHPPARPVPVGDPASRTATVHATARRILYIDDDAGTRRLVEKLLGRRGHRRGVRDSGQTGIAEAGQGGFDLIAVDHYMPGMDGLATLNELRSGPIARRWSMSPDRKKARSRSPR